MSNPQTFQIQEISAHPGPVPGQGTRREAQVCKYVDVTTCIGCKACEVACVEWNEHPFRETTFDDTYQTMNQPTAPSSNMKTASLISSRTIALAAVIASQVVPSIYPSSTRRQKRFTSARSVLIEWARDSNLHVLKRVRLAVFISALKTTWCRSPVHARSNCASSRASRTPAFMIRHQ